MRSRTRGPRRWRVSALALLCAASLGLFACSPDFQDGVGPRVPPPNVTGSAMRGSSPAVGVEVGLRTAAGQEVASTRTNGSGGFGFGEVGPGDWEIKITGASAVDFESLTRPFTLAAPTLALAPLNVFAYGAAMDEPPEGATVALPNPIQPLVFTWTPPQVAGAAGRVQVYDAAGAAVWFSPAVTNSQAPWNGLGNQGAYQGRSAAAGHYSWRIKFDLADSSQAKTALRRLTLQ